MSGKLGTGRRIFFAVAEEPAPGHTPEHADYLLVEPVLPAAWRAQQPEVSTGTINRSGLPSAMVAGRVSLPVAFGMPLSAPHLRQYAYHLLGSSSRVVLEAGVYQHTFVLETLEHPDPTLSLLAGLPPIDRSRVDGIRLRQLVMTAQVGNVVQVRFDGMGSHTTRMGPPEADPANTGTHTGPRVRGLLVDETAGDVYVQVTRTVAGGGLRWKVEQTTGVPAFGGSDVDLVANLDTPAQTPWMAMQGADGIDLGSSGKLWDPLEISWGAVADLGTLAVGDIYRFRRPTTWTAPNLAASLPANVFTHPQIRIKTRLAGSSDPFYVHEREQVTITLVNSVVDRGSGEGRYPTLYRPGDTTCQLVFARPYTDAIFEQMTTQHRRLEIVVEMQGGAQLSPSYRETVEIKLASCGIPQAQRNIQNAGPVAEQITLALEQPVNSDPPITIRTVCATDWTPPA